MRNKIISLAVLLFILISISSCVMRQVRPQSNYFHPSRTHRHWGARKVAQRRHQFWGRHRYGPRPYQHRGHFNY